MKSYADMTLPELWGELKPGLLPSERQAISECIRILRAGIRDGARRKVEAIRESERARQAEDLRLAMGETRPVVQSKPAAPRVYQGHMGFDYEEETA